MTNIQSIKTKVVAISGPGASLNDPSSVGEIVKVEDSFFGTFAEVVWVSGEKEGHSERIMMSSIKTEVKGIGLYWA